LFWFQVALREMEEECAVACLPHLGRLRAARRGRPVTVGGGAACAASATEAAQAFAERVARELERLLKRLYVPPAWDERARPPRRLPPGWLMALVQQESASAALLPSPDPLAAPPPAAGPEPLSTPERRILDALADGTPRQSKAIARRAGYKSTSSIRRVL